MKTIDKLNNWIAALKSGKYKQGRWCLKNDTGYCCLGIYLETDPDYNLTDPANWEDKFNELTYKDVLYNKEFLPSKLAEELGLSVKVKETLKENIDNLYKWLDENNITLSFESDSFQKFLSTMNDSGVPFEKIAEFLELFFIPLLQEK